MKTKRAARPAASGIWKLSSGFAPSMRLMRTAARVSTTGPASTTRYQTQPTRQSTIRRNRSLSAGQPPMIGSRISAASSGPIGRIGAPTFSGSRRYQTQAHQESA